MKTTRRGLLRGLLGLPVAAAAAPVVMTEGRWVGAQPIVVTIDGREVARAALPHLTQALEDMHRRDVAMVL